MRTHRALVALLTLLLALVAPTAAQAGTAGNPHRSTVQPLERAHAHNDYEHDRPLLDALDHGFTSVEADVWLVDGELYLGHDAPDLTRTLRDEYLEPLVRRRALNGGAIYPGWDGTFRLMVDVKSADGAATWRVLEQQLAEYPQLVTTYRNGRVQERAVTVVVSGNRDLSGMSAATVRRSFYDGRLADLGKGISPTLMPLVSDNWVTRIGYVGGAFTDAQRATLRRYVDAAHAQGYKIRFWATPDQPGATRDTVWAEELAADVDAFNTDHLADLQAWLLAHDPAEG